MSAELERLMREREPDPDTLERERLVPTPAWRPPRPGYWDPDFYEPLERVVLTAIAGILEGRRS